MANKQCGGPGPQAKTNPALQARRVRALESPQQQPQLSRLLVEMASAGIDEIVVNEMFQQHASVRRLQQLAAQLGSDDFVDVLVFCNDSDLGRGQLGEIDAVGQAQQLRLHRAVKRAAIRHR